LLRKNQLPTAIDSGRHFQLVEKSIRCFQPVAARFAVPVPKIKHLRCLLSIRRIDRPPEALGRALRKTGQAKSSDRCVLASLPSYGHRDVTDVHPIRVPRRLCSIPESPAGPVLCLRQETVQVYCWLQCFVSWRFRAGKTLILESFTSAGRQKVHWLTHIVVWRTGIAGFPIRHKACNLCASQS
jgi:hypothetical protein